MRRAAERLLDIELNEEQAPIRMVAYMTLVNTSASTDEALLLIDAAKAFAETRNISTANLLLSEIGLRANAGDGEGFQRAIQDVSARHGNDPEVMAKLQLPPVTACWTTATGRS